jgi:hypothetical protein
MRILTDISTVGLLLGPLAVLAWLALDAGLALAILAFRGCCADVAPGGHGPATTPNP